MCLEELKKLNQWRKSEGQGPTPVSDLSVKGMLSVNELQGPQVKL